MVKYLEIGCNFILSVPTLSSSRYKYVTLIVKVSKIIILHDKIVYLCGAEESMCCASFVRHSFRLEFCMGPACSYRTENTYAYRYNSMWNSLTLSAIVGNMKFLAVSYFWNSADLCQWYRNAYQLRSLIIICITGDIFCVEREKIHLDIFLVMLNIPLPSSEKNTSDLQHGFSFYRIF